MGDNSIFRPGRFLKAWLHDLRYLRLIGYREAIFFAICKYMRWKTLRRIPVGNDTLFIRTGTADLGIAMKWLIDELYNNIKSPNPSVIMDAGAHIGASAIFFSKKYPNAKIYAIEPEQENYENLLRNIEKRKNIIPIKAAIWGHNETRTIRDRLTGSWGFTIEETGNKTTSTDQQVDCITIESLMNEYNLQFIDILKMDIEGAEKAVFETSDSWIERVGIIAAELHDRICVGCEKAFYVATREFRRFESSGEYVIAYRE